MVVAIDRPKKDLAIDADKWLENSQNINKNWGWKIWLNFTRNLSKSGELFFWGCDQIWQNLQECATEVSFF
jgi:hypothetical protein